MFILNVGFVQESSAQKSKDKKVYSEKDRLRINSFFFEGQREKLIGNMDKARTQFIKLIEIDPTHAAALYELASIEMAENNAIAALAYAEKSYAADPSIVWIGKLYALLLTRNGELKNAEKTYSTLVKTFPEEEGVLFDLAGLQVKMNRFSNALETVDKIEDLKGKSSQLAELKGSIYKAEGKPEDFIKYLNSLIANDPGNLELNFLLARELLSQNKLEAAETELLKLNSSQNGNIKVVLMLSDLYRIKGESEKSHKFLRLAFSSPDLEIDNKVKYLIPMLNLIGIDSKMKERVDELSTDIRQAHPEDPRALALRGDFLSQTNNYKEAADLYKEAVASIEGKKKFLIWQQFLFIQHQLRDWEELKKYSDQALELFPNQALVYFLNGTALKELGELKKAKTILEMGQSYAVNDAELLLDFRAVLGSVYNSLGDFNKSDKQFDKILESDPTNHLALNNYSYYLSERGENLEKAIEMIKTAIKLSGDNPSYLDTYAWTLYKNGDYNEALIQVNESLAKGGSGSSEILEHKGDILYRMGKIDEAKDAWKKAGELNQESESLKKKISEGRLP